MTTKKDTEKKQATRRKKQADPEKVQEAVQDVKPFEMCWVWKAGDNIEKVAQALTGYSYNVFKLLDHNHIQAGDIKPGTVLKWEIK